MQTELYTIQGVENILTPALIYYKDEIFGNTRKTIEIDAIIKVDTEG